MVAVTVKKIVEQKNNKHVNNVKKVKVSPNTPGVDQRVPGGLGSQIFMTFGT
jgi:hypothetical protein